MHVRFDDHQVHHIGTYLDHFLALQRPLWLLLLLHSHYSGFSGFKREVLIANSCFPENIIFSMVTTALHTYFDQHLTPTRPSGILFLLHNHHCSFSVFSSKRSNCWLLLFRVLSLVDSHQLIALHTYFDHFLAPHATVQTAFPLTTMFTRASQGVRTLSR